MLDEEDFETAMINTRGKMRRQAAAAAAGKRRSKQETALVGIYWDYY